MNKKAKARQRKLATALGPKAMRFLQRWLSRKPTVVLERLGVGFGDALWRIPSKRRERAISNLALAFPEWSDQQHRAVARRTFQHFARSAADFLGGANRDLAVLRRECEVVGLRHLDEALAQRKGVLLITGHLGNWERTATFLSLSGYRLNVVIRDADQEGVNSVVNRLREGPGTSVIPRGNAARPILEKLRDNQIVGILPDQNTAEVFIPFFGHPAGTVLGPGVLHERTGAPVIPFACFWIAPGRYRMTFYPPLQSIECEGVKGEGMMRAIHAWLESVIREHPDQWLWFHDRWRSARKRGLL